MTTARTFHPVAQTSECHVRFTVDGKEAENVYAFRWASGPPPGAGALLSLATELWNTYVRKYQVFTTAEVEYIEVYCRNVDTEIANQATYPAPSLTVGSIGGSSAANNAALSPVKRTGLTGRSHHGALRYSGFAQGDVAGNNVANSVAVNIANLLASVIAPRVGSLFIPALASRKLAVSIPLQTVNIINHIVDSIKRRIVDE